MRRKTSQYEHLKDRYKGRGWEERKEPKLNQNILIMEIQHAYC